MTRFLVVAVLVLLGAVPAAAQEAFPSRTITIVNPYPPGGQADLSGRPFAIALAKVLKQPVIIAKRLSPGFCYFARDLAETIRSRLGFHRAMC